jgi:hypothetical protein
MSGKISGMVWDLDLSQRDLLVLLAITDHADHDGCNMFPSIALLAWKTGYSQRTVIRILNGLVTRGILIRHTRAGKPTIYDANLDAAPKKVGRPKVEKKRATRDIAMTHDKAMSVVTTSPVMKNTTPDTPSRNVQDEPSIKQPSERENAPLPTDDDGVPDHVPPNLRRIAKGEEPQPVAPDGKTLAYTLIEAYCDAWEVTIPKYRDQWHRAQQRGANDLAALDASPDEVRAMVAERRAKGKQPDECPMVYLAGDYVGWKHRQTAPQLTVITPTPEETAADAARREADRLQWWKEQGLA